jgi:hypothetical protein
MSLYHGFYVREGDPYTGKGYEHGENGKGTFSGSQVYITQYDDNMIVPLRKDEIIKRIVIMPKKMGDLMRVPRTYIMMVLKRAEWMD